MPLHVRLEREFHLKKKHFGYDPGLYTLLLMSLKRDIEFVLPLVINLQLAKLSADLKPSQGNNCCTAVCRGGGTLLGAHKKTCCFQ